MKTKHIPIGAFLVVVVAFITAIWANSVLPVTVAVHWDMNGVADGYGSKFSGVWLFPLIMLATYILLALLSRIDPKAGNIEKFQRQWFNFLIYFEAFLLYVYGLSIYWNLGHRFGFINAMIVGLSSLSFAIAYLLKDAEQNFTIGIRTPWTLGSVTVWDRTHALATKLFVASGFVSLIGLTIPKFGFVVVLGSISLAGIWSVVYSFFEYRKVADK